MGTFVSAIQNSLHKHNEGARGVFTRTGGTIGLFTAMGAGFTLVDSSVANFRETDDAWNGVALVALLLFWHWTDLVFSWTAVGVPLVSWQE